MHLNKLAFHPMGHGEEVLAVQWVSSPGQQSTWILALRGQVCLRAERIIGTIIRHRGAWLLPTVCLSPMTFSTPLPRPFGLEMCLAAQQALGGIAMTPPSQKCTHQCPSSAREANSSAAWQSDTEGPLPTQIDIHLIF